MKPTTFYLPSEENTGIVIKAPYKPLPYSHLAGGGRVDMIYIKQHTGFCLTKEEFKEAIEEFLKWQNSGVKFKGQGIDEFLSEYSK